MTCPITTPGSPRSYWAFFLGIDNSHEKIARLNGLGMYGSSRKLKAEKNVSQAYAPTNQKISKYWALSRILWF